VARTACRLRQQSPLTEANKGLSRDKGKKVQDELKSFTQIEF